MNEAGMTRHVLASDGIPAFGLVIVAVICVGIVIDTLWLRPRRHRGR
jgi:hypothetical protein